VISLLLAQASVAEEVVAHPTLTLIIISALFSALIAVMKVLLGFMEKRVNEKFDAIEKRDVERAKATDEKFDSISVREDKQEVRLDKIDLDLRSYDKYVAVGVRETSEIHAAVSRTEFALASHVEKEEGTTWVKIDNLVDAVNAMKLSNEVAHAGLVAGQTILGSRVEALEKKMPNGELEKLAAAYHALAERDMYPKKTINKKRVKR